MRSGKYHSVYRELFPGRHLTDWQKLNFKFIGQQRFYFVVLLTSIIRSRFKAEHNAVLSDLQIKLEAWWELIIISLKRETSRDWLRFRDKSDEMNKKDAFECRQNVAKRAAVSFHHLSRGSKCLIFDNFRSTVSGFSFISSFQRHVMQISQRCIYLPRPCPGLPARHWQHTHFDFVIVSWYSRVTSARRGREAQLLLTTGTASFSLGPS